MSNQPFSAMDHITNWLMRPRIGDSKPPTLWPSSAAAVDSNGNHYGACRRRTFLSHLVELHKYRTKTNSRNEIWDQVVNEVTKMTGQESRYMYWIWEQGNLFEDHCLDLFKESGIFMATQVQVYLPEYNVSGKIDAIVMDPMTGKFIICETKSVYGYNADKVLGTNFDRKYGQAGEPRDYNLMQIAIYQYAFTDETYGFGQLIYGDRGTGKYATYEVDVDKSTGSIRHRTINPTVGSWVTVPYTVFDILNVYKEVTRSIEAGSMPARDFSIKYTFDKLEELTDASYKVVELDKEENPVAEFETVKQFIEAVGDKKSRKFLMKARSNVMLSKDIAEQFVKYTDRKVNGGKVVKAPEAGDYQCRYCPFTLFCYDENGNLRERTDVVQ